MLRRRRDHEGARLERLQCRVQAVEDGNAVLLVRLGPAVFARVETGDVVAADRQQVANAALAHRTQSNDKKFHTIPHSCFMTASTQRKL
jgi:hypothetical protein